MRHLLASLCGAALALAFCGCMGSPTTEEFQALDGRVAAIEKKLSAAPAAPATPAAPAVTAPAAPKTPAPPAAPAAPAVTAPVAPAAPSAPVAAAAGELPMIGKPNAAKSVWKCARVAKGPAIDGDLSDEAWKQACQVKLVGEGDPAKRLGNDTAVLICHDGEKLYVAALCLESEMGKLNVKCTKRDDKIYGDDCVEFYLDAESKGEKAVKLVVNPDGVFMDFYRLARGDGENVTWSVEIKTQKLADRYVLEFSIPLKELGVEGKPDAAFKFNALRMRHGNGKASEHSTWWGHINKIDTLGKVVFE